MLLVEHYAEELPSHDEGNEKQTIISKYIQLSKIYIVKLKNYLTIKGTDTASKTVIYICFNERIH